MKPENGPRTPAAGMAPSNGRAPVRIGRRDPSRLVFTWADGSVTEAPAQALRRSCPCAHCVDEHSGRPILDPSSVPASIEQREVSLMGNYALSIRFSDGHRTGIYTWDALRRVSGA